MWYTSFLFYYFYIFFICCLFSIVCMIHFYLYVNPSPSRLSNIFFFLSSIFFFFFFLFDIYSLCLSIFLNHKTEIIKLMLCHILKLIKHIKRRKKKIKRLYKTHIDLTDWFKNHAFNFGFRVYLFSHKCYAWVFICLYIEWFTSLLYKTPPFIIRTINRCWCGLKSI
jgi:hypothetical protein